MQIVLASAEVPPAKSGYARFAGSLGRELIRRGHAVTYLSDGVGVSRLRKIARLTPAGRSLIRARPDVVQLVGPSPMFSEQVVETARSSSVPTVYNIHSFAGLETYYSGLPAYLVDAIYRRTYLARAIRHASWVVYSTRDFAATMPVRPGQRSVIPLGVDDPCLAPGSTASFPAPDPHADPDELRILFVGQLRRYKGVGYLIDAAALLRHTGRPFHLTIVGGGRERESLETKVARLGLGPSVEFRGLLDDAALHAEYLRNDVLVLPSLLGESFGIVLLEAALHGLQVVATDLPGVGEVARDLGGTVVAPCSAGAIASALAALPPRKSGPRRLNLAVAERYSWPAVARAYEQTYEALLGH
jgi:glycosyltransferase involved in cell wall biosynthesis